MTRGEAWFSHVANALVGGTGLVYGWTCYFARTDDPFAVVNHPWQPHLQHLHVLTAPLVVFASGLFWTDHVWRRVRSGHRPRKTSGLGLFSLLVPMIASGYLLQTATGEGWRRVWIVLHVATSCAWVAFYVVHQLAPRRERRKGVSTSASSRRESEAASRTG